VLIESGHTAVWCSIGTRVDGRKREWRSFREREGTGAAPGRAGPRRDLSAGRRTVHGDAYSTTLQGRDAARGPHGGSGRLHTVGTAAGQQSRTAGTGTAAGGWRRRIRAGARRSRQLRRRLG